MLRRVRRYKHKGGRRERKSGNWRVIYKKLEKSKGVTMQCYYGAGSRTRGALDRIERLASENAVVVFSVSTCCMCHVVKRLFCSLGVSPTVYELDEIEDMGGAQQLKEALAELVGDPPVPAVFIGGKLVGGLDRVMATHISGNLIPLLKEAGALWL